MFVIQFHKYLRQIVLNDNVDPHVHHFSLPAFSCRVLGVLESFSSSHCVKGWYTLDWSQVYRDMKTNEIQKYDILVMD